MANSDRVFETLRTERERLRREFGVRSLGLFGSWARGMQSASSDVDILVDLESPSFDRYMELKFFLEELLGCPVDLVLRRALKPALRDRILREVREVA